jgi:hypothetical protein
MCCWKSTINHGTSENSTALPNFVSCSLPVCLYSALRGCFTCSHLNFRLLWYETNRFSFISGTPITSEVNLDWYVPWLTRFVYSEYDSCFFLTCWLLFHLFFVQRMQHRHIISLHLDGEREWRIPNIRWKCSRSVSFYETFWQAYLARQNAV